MQSEKTWTSSVWISCEQEEEQVFHASSIVEIRNNVFQWLTENSPETLSNAPTTYEQSQRYMYQLATEKNPLNPSKGIYSAENDEMITSGWVGFDGSGMGWSRYNHFESISELAEHFVKDAIKIRKGPDWGKIEVVDNQIPLHLVNSVKKINDEIELNDYLRAGWYLLSIDSSGYVCSEGKLVDRNSQYVIGHPEENADQFVAT